jgi:A/G-specific adenine glycosylase
LAKDLLPSKREDMPVYTQALMDFGATWCTSRKPVCFSGERKCPYLKECQANLSDQVLLFPQKKVKVKSPELNCNMLLMRSGNSILLQKRASKAIWGGLWSLPESPWKPRASAIQALDISTKDLLAAALPNEKITTLLRSSPKLIRGEQIKHVFTHRRLWIQIWEASLSKPFEFSNTDLKWVELSQLGRYGLPQPIKVLLQQLSLVRGGGLKN